MSNFWTVVIRAPECETTHGIYTDEAVANKAFLTYLDTHRKNPTLGWTVKQLVLFKYTTYDNGTVFLQEMEDRETLQAYPTVTPMY